MSRNHLILAAVIVIIAAAAAAAAIAIELGLAFQSQSDSSEDIPVGDYVKAHDSEDKMVSITPVVYSQSQDKESYVLTNVNQSVRGLMEVGTEANVMKNMTSLITFQEAGTWMLIETMDLTLQRETGFTILVNNLTNTLDALTVITIDSTGHAKRDINDGPITGSWKVWGVGDIKENYNPSAQSSAEDPYRGFLVLVDSSYLLKYHYNVLAISGNNGSTKVDLYTAKNLGEEIISGDEWKAWNLGNPVRGYSLKSTDVYRCTDPAVHVSIYDSLSGEGVAGKQTDPIDVRTGTYNFYIDIQYKSSIKIDPSRYHGENMKSNVVFILADKPRRHNHTPKPLLAGVHPRPILHMLSPMRKLKAHPPDSPPGR